MKDFANTLLHSSRAAARGRTKDAQPVAAKEIDTPLSSGSSGTDDGEIDAFAVARARASAVPSPARPGRWARSCDSGIPGRAQHGRHWGSRRELPGERVLAAAAADHEDLHRRSLI